MQTDADLADKSLSLRECLPFPISQQAMFVHGIQCTCARYPVADPAKGVQVTQATGTLFDIGFDFGAHFIERLIAYGLFGRFGLEERPVLKDLI